MLKTPCPDDISNLDRGKSRTLERSAVLQCPVEILAASSKRSCVSEAVGHVQVIGPHQRRVIHGVVFMTRGGEVRALRNWEANVRAEVY